MPILSNVLRIDGQVPSPTPMVLTLGDSTSVISSDCCCAILCSAAITPAVNQPALPPPTMIIFLIALSIVPT